jgi:hypothetical protein
MATKDGTAAFKEMLDHMGEIDPFGALIIASAGVAGACGVKGPLTTLVGGIGSALGGGSGSDNSTNPLLLLTPLAPEVVMSGINYLFTSASQGPAHNATDSEKTALLTAIGNATGNMVEAGLMYELFKNPETFKAVVDITKQAANGAMGLAKAGAALLK